MRKQLPEKLASARIHVAGYYNKGFDGAFRFMGPHGTELRIISSTAGLAGSGGWEHVSVSCAKRMPNWIEMCLVKDLFWDEDEIVFQLHPAKSQWVNNHPNCLHLWRNINQDPPMPPAIFVGVKEEGVLRDRAHAREAEERLRKEGKL